MLTLYHGSCRAITEFAPERYAGVGGIYFTADREEAGDHARCACIEDGDIPTVMTVELDLRNPYAMTGIESHDISTGRIAALQALGYDGVVGQYADGTIFEYVAFDPAQVRIISIDTIELAAPQP